MPPGILLEQAELLSVDRLEQPGREEAVEDALHATLVDDGVEADQGSQARPFDGERRLDLRAVFDHLAPGLGLADGRLDRPPTAADLDDPAQLGPRTDATGGDLHVGERGRQEAVWPVVLPIVGDAVIDDVRRCSDQALGRDSGLHPNSVRWAFPSVPHGTCTGWYTPFDAKARAVGGCGRRARAQR